MNGVWRKFLTHRPDTAQHSKFVDSPLVSLWCGIVEEIKRMNIQLQVNIAASSVKWVDTYKSVGVTQTPDRHATYDTERRWTGAPRRFLFASEDLTPPRWGLFFPPSAGSPSTPSATTIKRNKRKYGSSAHGFQNKILSYDSGEKLNSRSFLRYFKFNHMITLLRGNWS